VSGGFSGTAWLTTLHPRYERGRLRPSVFLAAVQDGLTLASQPAIEMVALSETAAAPKIEPQPQFSPRWLSDAGGRAHTMGAQREWLGVQGTLP
jgi:hypothetical protein